MINLRTLKPLDRDTIVNSVRKTHRLVTAEEGWPQSGVGAELVALVNEEVGRPRRADRACPYRFISYHHGVGAELVVLVNEEVVRPCHADRACLACLYRLQVASCLPSAGGCCLYAVYASMRRA